jgi:O-antigen/teichoic acid export membrane protein
VGLTLAQFLVSIGLNIYLVVLLRIGVAGVFWTNLLTTALFALAGTALNRRYYSLAAVTRARLGEIVRYGMPLVLGGISIWSIDSVDRYFLLKFASLEDVGLYSVAARLASGVAFATWAFRLANAPFQFEVASGSDAPRIYSRTLNYYALVVSTLCVAIAAFAHPALRVITTEAYLGAHRVVGLMAFSAGAYGLYQIVGVGLLITKRTGFTAAAIGAAAVLNVIFQAVLVPRLGAVGAALAVLLTHCCVVVMLYVGAQRAFYVPYELGLLARVVGPAAAIVAVRALIAPGGLLLDIGVAAGLLVGYWASLALLGAVRADHVKVLRQALRGAA